MSTPERVDLRVSGCVPYPGVVDQGADQSCVAHSFTVAIHCLKNGLGLPAFPVSRLSSPSLERIFAEAIELSPDRGRGTSFESVVESALRAHAADLKLLGWRVVSLPGSVAQCKRRLRLGSPVVAGYQVNARIARFHSDARACVEHGFLLPPFRADPRAESAHAVLIMGFDDEIGCFLARNSWGSAWGVDGHFLIRYEDLEDRSFFTDLVGFARLEEPVRAQPNGARTS